VCWWCGLGEAPRGEGPETDLTEGPQETAPAGQKDSSCHVMTCWGSVPWGGGSRLRQKRSRRRAKGCCDRQPHVTGCKQRQALSTVGREAKDPRQPKPGGPCCTWAPAKPPRKPVPPHNRGALTSPCSARPASSTPTSRASKSSFPTASWVTICQETPRVHRSAQTPKRYQLQSPFRGALRRHHGRFAGNDAPRRQQAELGESRVRPPLTLLADSCSEAAAQLVVTDLFQFLEGTGAAGCLHLESQDAAEQGLYLCLTQRLQTLAQHPRQLESLLQVLVFASLGSTPETGWGGG